MLRVCKCAVGGSPTVHGCAGLRAGEQGRTASASLHLCLLYPGLCTRLHICQLSSSPLPANPRNDAAPPLRMHRSTGPSSTSPRSVPGPSCGAAAAAPSSCRLSSRWQTRRTCEPAVVSAPQALCCAVFRPCDAFVRVRVGYARTFVRPHCPRAVMSHRSATPLDHARLVPRNLTASLVPAQALTRPLGA